MDENPEWVSNYFSTNIKKMTEERAIGIANEIMDLYEQHGGSEYAGEKISQLEHMVQAAQLAEEKGFDEEVILAAFLHDIGHIAEQAGAENKMDEYGLKDHESIGAEYLIAKGFSYRIVRLVASHVNAKRYLTRTDPDYYNQLSEASRKTLEFQGGMMSAEEAEDFEKDPLFSEIILMRRWDEQAKVEDKPVPDLYRYRTMIINHLLT
jgi:phosphonate degradation associated HDIG domain protein